jgi:predicted flap endonuclease-1-like 5' DNA nuclease
MTKLTTIEGIGESFAQKLQDAGVTTTEMLLDKGATPAGRKAVAEATGISETLILKWANRADLFRVKGIGEEYADLLEAAGVDTVPDLARRNAENLHEKLTAVNAEKALVRRVPTLKAVQGWVADAKELPRKLTY